MRKTGVIVCVVLSLLLMGCTRKAAVPAPRPTALALHDWMEVRYQLHLLFNDPNFLNAQWGVMIQSLDSGEIVYQRNAEKILMPASNMKLPTAASALLHLGPDYIYRTRLLAMGARENGVLKGDLWVEGSGDPAICARFNEEDSLRVFREWAAKLRAAGIQRIEGNIVGDDDAFEDVSLGSGWAWDYLSAGYAAEVGALQLNENIIDLILQPGPAPGAPAVVQLRPSTKFAELTNRAVTAESSAEADINVDRALLSNQISISGRIPAGSKETRRSIAVYNPTLYFVQVLKEILESEGIRVDGRAVDIDALAPKPAKANATVLWTHESPKLIEILKVLLKESQNLYAETLVKTLGRELSGQGTFAAGRGVVQEVLGTFSVPRDSWIMADGSGLSRYNYIAPEHLVRLLRGMYRRKEFSLFFDCLPIAGVDGTLRSRLKGTRAENNVRAKTGSIANVRTLSGYVRTADGEMLAFSIQANNFNVASRLVEYDQDLALEMLANFSHRK